MKENVNILLSFCFVPQERNDTFYGCPSKSVYLKKNGWITVKDGFCLDNLEKGMDNISLLPLEEVKAGIGFMGVTKYLKDMGF